MTSPRLLSPRWLAAGGAVVLAAVIGVALVLQNSGAACAAPPSTSASKGKATFYDLAGGTGNCSFPGAPADDLFVALGPSQYSGAAACGTYLDVTGPKGKVRVKVIDSCPECGVGHLDLSRTAFKRIADEVQGIVPISYRTVAASPGSLSVRVKEGSSKYWFAVLIDNHGRQLRSVTVNGKATQRTDFNYWLVENAAIGSGPYKIKVTDVTGKSATMSGIKLSPGVTQRTGVRMGSAGTVKPAPAATSKKASPAPKKTTPAPKVSSAAPLVESATVTPEAVVETTAPPVETAVDLAADTPRC